MIKGYCVLVNPVAVGFEVTAWVRIKLEATGENDLTRFQRAVDGRDTVRECYMLAATTASCSNASPVISPSSSGS